MCSMSVLCPLCARSSFASIDALRCSLIKAANGPLPCPICHELFLGLDKLTIHLFSHTSIMSTTTTTRSSESVADADVGVSANTENEVNTESDLATHHTSEKRTRKQHSRSREECAVVGGEPGATMRPTNNTSSASEQSSNSTTPPQVLVSCDICEFTFRNEEVRDMHLRLVHQSQHSPRPLEPADTEAPISADCNVVGAECRTAGAGEGDFRCHFCAKTFKMKGSLRVHLKVVHLVGLPHNSPKLNICDRIRHKEARLTKVPQHATATATATLSSSESPQHLYNIASLSQLPPGGSNAPLSISTSNGTGVLSTRASGELRASTTELHTAVGFNSNVPASANVDPKATFKQPPLSTTSPSTSASASASPPASPPAPTLASTSASSLRTDSDRDAVSKTTTTTAITTTTPATDNPKIWECDVCSKAFTTKYFLKKHKRLHTGEMPYTCEICARTFTFQQSYHKHLLYHSDEKPHVCSTCGRAFKELSTLHNHERIHSGEKPFRCEVCGKSFRQRVSFLVHTRIHTGVMPYKCVLCQKSFRYKVSQRTHKCQMPPAAAEPNKDTVDHISENFIRAFLESNHTEAPSRASPASVEIVAITSACCPSGGDSLMDAKTMLDQALLTKTIDDIVVESCNKLGIGSDASSPRHVGPQCTVPASNICDLSALDYIDRSTSPSQKLQNMSLYSPQLVASDLNGLDSDFSRFLLEASDNAASSFL